MVKSSGKCRPAHNTRVVPCTLTTFDPCDFASVNRITFKRHKKTELMKILWQRLRDWDNLQCYKDSKCNIRLEVAMNKWSRFHCYNKALHTLYDPTRPFVYPFTAFFTLNLSSLFSTIPFPLLQEADLLYFTSANPLLALKPDCRDLLNWCKWFQHL